MTVNKVLCKMFIYHRNNDYIYQHNIPMKVTSFIIFDLPNSKSYKETFSTKFSIPSVSWWVQGSRSRTVVKDRPSGVVASTQHCTVVQDDGMWHTMPEDKAVVAISRGHSVIVSLKKYFFFCNCNEITNNHG